MQPRHPDARCGEPGDAPGSLETDAIPIRMLTAPDADAVARIDALAVGRSRPEFFRNAIAAAARPGGVSLCFAAEQDATIVGFLVASVAYGEFGIAEPVAVVDAIGVHPDYRHRHVAGALFRQLALSLSALRIERVRTQVDWSRTDLLGFFRSQGFAPVPRLVLEAPTSGLPGGQ